MDLPEDIQRLNQRRDSGELSPEEYAAEKSRLLDAAVNRIDTWSPKPLTSRVVPRVLSGTVTSIVFSDRKEKATVWLGTQRVTITRLGKPILIANGDRVRMAGTQSADSFKAAVYINETNGDNSVDETLKLAPKWIWAGAAGMLGVLAILVTAAMAALREPTFLSLSGAGRTAIYVISIVAALALGGVSLFILGVGTLLRYMADMLDREHHKFARG